MADGLEDGRVERSPPGGFELGVAHPFPGCRSIVAGWSRGLRKIFSDGEGEVIAPGRVVVHRVVDTSDPALRRMDEGAGGIIPVNQINRGVGRSKGEWLATSRRGNEARPPGTVDAAKAEGGAPGLEGETFRFHKDIAGGSASGRGGLIDLASIVAGVDRGASGEDAELGGKNIEEVAQGFDVGKPVGLGVAPVLAAETMKEDVRGRLSFEDGAELCPVGGVSGKGAVGLGSQAVDRLGRRHQGGDRKALA